jgi:hypothetical protein
LKKAAAAMIQALVENREMDRGPLEYAIKIKAVQEKDPSRGVAFIHLLKEILREMPADSVPQSELADICSRIDQIASLASEMFLSNRAKIALLVRVDALNRGSVPSGNGREDSGTQSP